MREIVIALTGNPNAGKTTVFNALTGSRRHVGNYPGVTVEKVEGWTEIDGRRCRVVDLPGTYSLSAHSPEEVVARDFLMREKPDVVVQVVDASNLERNLYLAVQLMELKVKMVVALNMTDVAKSVGRECDVPLLSQLLKMPVVSTVGNRAQGMEELLRTALDAAERPLPDYPAIPYPRSLEKAVEELDAALRNRERELAGGFPPRWFAARLLENDPSAVSRATDPAIAPLTAKLRAAFEAENGDPPEIRAAEARYGWIAGLTAEATRLTPAGRSDMSDKADTVLLHRFLGIPIFLLMMYAMFHLVFTLSQFPMELIENGFSLLGEKVAALWPEGSDSPLRALLVEGIIGGVGGVLVFLPNIILLFLAIAFLEGTGYMARAAFIMDRFMHRIGLHGKSFIPMLLGFGCTVPAIMATRTLENRRDRLTTIMVLPLMSCGARLPIYSLLIPAFFPEYLRAWMLWLIYLIGIAFAVLGARLLRATLFKGPSIPFVMELPPYRMPTFRSVMVLMWDRAWEYCKKAGTIILAASILLWAMTAYPKKTVFDRDYETELARLQTAAENASGAEQERYALLEKELTNAQRQEELAYSLSGRIGRFLEPVLHPLGFDWRVGTAIIGSFAAKEVFVAQMGIVHSVGEADEESESLRDTLRSRYTPLQAFCMMLYCLLSLPCIATIAVARRETGSWGYAAFMIVGLTALAYIVTLVVFQAGSALGIGG